MLHPRGSQAVDGANRSRQAVDGGNGSRQAVDGGNGSRNNVAAVRRLAMALVVLAVVAVGVLAWPPVAAAADAPGDATPAGVSVTRYGGADRYETSLLAAEAVASEAGGSLDTAVLVSGRNWADAVVAAPVAGSLGAPLLMTPPNELRDDAVSFLRRVGVSRVLLIGTKGADDPFGAEVISSLMEMGFGVERIGGADRYATGALAAGRIDAAGSMSGFGRTAIVASGEVFADALVAGPIGARGSHPVMLTPPDELHAEVAQQLSTMAVSHVVVMGGTAALSDAVEQSLDDLGIEVTRLAGADRYDTAVLAAELVAGRYSDTAGQTCFTSERVGLARARVPFDSFSAGPLLGRLCAPLLLADPGNVPPPTAGYLDSARAALGESATVDLRVFGGDAAVSQSAIDGYLSGGGAAGSEPSEDQTDDGPAVETGDAGVVAAGTCGGSVDDEPAPLLDSDFAEDPSWSPDCSRIVYSDDGSLWIMDNDGTDRKRVTAYDGAFSHDPFWSPDGSRIVYTRGRCNDDGHWFSHIYEVGVDGTGRTKLSKGDVEDSKPSFSPAGDRIVFERFAGSGRDTDGSFLDADRYIVTMDASGSDRTALTMDGRWEHLPTWSPDGSRISYVSDEAVWLIDPDGSNPTRVVEGAFWRGGTSFSPDGSRIAFGRGDLAQSSLLIADLASGAESTVVELPGRNSMPRWSPDGQRLAFSRVVPHDAGQGQTSFTHHAYTVGASGEEAAPATDCRPAGLDGTTAGFPPPSWAAPSVGTLRVAVLFMDFDDKPATRTTEEESASSLAEMEQYLEAASYGQLDVEILAHHEWLRAGRPHAEYIGLTGFRQGLGRTAGEHAVALADDEVDFSDIDAVMTVFPSSYFGGGNAGGFVTADGVTVPHSRINDKPDSEQSPPEAAADWGITAAHELAHNLGLADLYPYDQSIHELPDPPTGEEWIPIEFGLMELNAYFLADASLLLRRTTQIFPGGRSWWDVVTLEALEMLAWSRWQLGWLSESQVRCVTEAEATVVLRPAALSGDGVVMAAVPLSHRQVIVIESRRQLGYDLGREFTWTRGGTGRRQALITEGVLVYTVDSLRGSGQLPMVVAGDSGNGQVDGFPVLKRGESVTLGGYTITVAGDDDDTHTVSVTRDG